MADDIAALIRKLASADPAARLAAAEKLGQLGEGAGSAATVLLACLSDEEETIREAAAGALEGLGPPPPEQLTELATRLSQGSAEIGYWAATLIGRLESAAAPATAALIGALQSASDLALRERAAWALGQIGPGAKSALESLSRAANSGSPRLARLAEQAIEQIRSS